MSDIIKVERYFLIKMHEELIHYYEEDIDALEHESGFIPEHEMEDMHDNLMERKDALVLGLAFLIAGKEFSEVFPDDVKTEGEDD